MRRHGVLRHSNEARDVSGRQPGGLVLDQKAEDLKAGVLREGVDILTRDPGRLEEPEEFAEIIRRDTPKWGAVIKAAGIKGD